MQSGYFALFLNTAERTPTIHRYNDSLILDLCDVSGTAKGISFNNPSSRVIPSRFLSFLELRANNLGLYTQTDGRQSSGNVLRAAFGFR